MRTWLVYKHTNTITGKSYIGQTVSSMEERWSKHCYSAFNRPEGYFHRAIVKYGKDVWESAILVADIDSQEEANRLETYYITEYRTVENGYNLNYGGDCTEMSDKTKKLLTDGIRKYRNTPVVKLYNISTQETFEGFYGDLEKSKGYIAGALSDVVHGRRKSMYGWVIDTEENRKYKPITRHWFVHPEFGADYCSLDELCRKYSNITSRGNMSAVVYGKRKSHQGWAIIKNEEN